jgi:hypothetical protein
MGSLGHIDEHVLATKRFRDAHEDADAEAGAEAGLDCIDLDGDLESGLPSTQRSI